MRASFRDSDFSLTKTVLLVVVLHIPGGVDERALPYLQ